MLTRIVILAGLLSVTCTLKAQSEPTASRVGDLKIGGGFSTANSDYGDRYNGGAAYVNFDFLPHIGVEGEFHFVKDPNDLYEKTYEIGGRYFSHLRQMRPLRQSDVWPRRLQLPSPGRRIPAKPGLQHDGWRHRRRLQS